MTVEFMTIAKLCERLMELPLDATVSIAYTRGADGDTLDCDTEPVLIPVANEFGRVVDVILTPPCLVDWVKHETGVK
jgi:hypothetical protein